MGVIQTQDLQNNFSMRGLISKKKSIILVLLLSFAFFVRLPQPLLKLIPFSFDHGRDALDILAMIKTGRPTLIGPWTSIPGLYFGPGWYYLLTPVFFIFGGDPVAPVYLMIFLVLLQVYLMYKEFGGVSALMVASAPLWMFISASAWNPYPMTLLSLLILIFLKKVKQNGLTDQLAFALGMTAGFGFHFSTAFAIFYPFIIGLSFLLRRVRLQIHTIIVGSLGFLLPFLPQLLFEVRHQFLQTRAVLRYIAGDRPVEVSFGLQKILEVLSVTLGELKLVVLPGIWMNQKTVEQLVLGIGVSILLFGFFLAIKKQQKMSLVIECLLFICVPVLGLFFLHFNVWYVLPMAPAAVILAAQYIRAVPAPLKAFFIVLLLVTPLSLVQRLFSEQQELMSDPQLLPVKLEVLAEIRKRADGAAFSSYHYVPDIYDFSYQYLYLWQADQGNALPTEFSYQPKENAYFPDKVSVLQAYPIPATSPEKIFFIVQGDPEDALIQSWWGRQQFGQIIDTQQFGKSIMLYEATPKK